MKRRRKKTKKSLIKEITTVIPELTPGLNKEENWYNYEDFLKENMVV